VELFLKRWWPVALAVALTGGLVVAQQPRGGLYTVNGQSISITGLSVSGDAGVSGNALIGGDLMVNGDAGVTGKVSIGNDISLPAGKHLLSGLGDLYDDGADDSWVMSPGLRVVGPVGTTTSFQSSATSGTQFSCIGAGPCLIKSATSQALTADCGGGTCTASLGASAATTTLIGRSGATTTINGATHVTTLAITGTTDLNTGTLDVAGTATASVRANALCVCWDTTSGVSLVCTVAATTLSLSGGVSGDGYFFLCVTKT
jgi:hypothetical protein